VAAIDAVLHVRYGFAKRRERVTQEQRELAGVASPKSFARRRRNSRGGARACQEFRVWGLA
jgi:hypothetical protein